VEIFDIFDHEACQEGGSMEASSHSFPALETFDQTVNQ